MTEGATSRSSSSQYQHDASGNPFENLHTILMLTQGITAAVVGTERRTLTTLNLGYLYNRGIRLQKSVGNNNWILRSGDGINGNGNDIIMCL